MTRPKELDSPFGQLATYMAVLSWIIAFMSGTFFSYGRPFNAFGAFAAIALMIGALVCAIVGLFKNGRKNRMLSVFALILLGGPFVVMFMTK
jgi:hypothetical protein